MTVYFRDAGVWKSSIQLYTNPGLGAQRYIREGYANISGTWRRWFPNGSWSASANLPFGIREGGSSNSESGFSSTIFGGATSLSPQTALTYEFNGTSWSSGGNMANIRSGNGGTGTAAAPLAWGGDNSSDTTEEYNASTNVWVAGGNISVGIVRLGSGAGTQTAALSFAGLYDGLGVASAEAITYNGTSWGSVAANLNFAGYWRSGCGTQTSAIATCWGGGDEETFYGIGKRVTETYNGTTWTSQASFGIFYNNNLSRSETGRISCTGTRNAAILAGNSSSFGAASYGEEFDGSSWSLTGSLLTNRDSHYSSGGLGNNSLVIGGDLTGGGTYLTSTERYTRIV